MKFTIRDWIWSCVLVVFAGMYMRQELRLQTQHAENEKLRAAFGEEILRLERRFDITANNMQQFSEDSKIAKIRLDNHAHDLSTVTGHIYAIRRAVEERRQAPPQPTRYRPQYPPPPVEWHPEPTPGGPLE